MDDLKKINPNAKVFKLLLPPLKQPEDDSEW